MSVPVNREEKPQIVGRYALYGEIASGGMATVHFGRLLGPVGFSRPVAIKRLHPHCARDPQFTKMFIDEARLASRIHHPNVVSTLDVVATDEELLLVMDYVQGESLARLLRNAMDRGLPIPMRIVLAILSNVLHGLHAAHEAKSETGEPLAIVHRDVSPQNVIVGIDGIARVLDFGIAHATARLETTREGHIKGKVTYMAPEQLAGADVDRRADVYAAAVMLWELLAGKRLFQKAEPQAVLLDKMFKTVERPSLHREDIPDALDAVALHGLERDPNKRFGTAREMALALEKYGPLATSSEVGSWVEATAKDALSLRSMKVAEFESAPPVCIDDLDPAAKSGIHRSDPPLAILPMKSDKYPVTTLASRAPTVIDIPRKRDSQAPSLSHRASMIGLDVAKFYGAGRTAKVAVAAAAASTMLLGLGFLAWSLGAPETGAAGGASASRVGNQGVTAAPTSAPILPAVIPPASCPSGMLPIPAGKFFMGFDDGVAVEKPAHQVSVAAFCMDQYEVTVDKYRECSDRGECKRALTTTEVEGPMRGLDACNAQDNHGKFPVNCVSWESANAYCQVHDARLPTEAEWEYAARGSDGRRFPWGDDPPGPRLLNACGKECGEWGHKAKIELNLLYDLDDGWATTAPVGSFPRGKSRYGLDDMVGNVSEWVFDWYAPYSSDAEVDPRGPPSGRSKVVRGGAWNAGQSAAVRPSYRARELPEKRSNAVGFRCAR